MENDCCPDIASIGCVGACAPLNITGCCTGSECYVNALNCYCDQTCYDHGDCCFDIASGIGCLPNATSSSSFSTSSIFTTSLTPFGK